MPLSPSSIIISFVVYLGYLGLNKVYFDIFSIWDFVVFLDKFYFSWCLQIFGFYFVHRAMHSKKLFRHTHKLHHLSTDPTPFATNSVHALEAVMDIGFYSNSILLYPIASHCSIHCVINCFHLEHNWAFRIRDTAKKIYTLLENI